MTTRTAEAKTETIESLFWEFYGAGGVDDEDNYVEDSSPKARQAEIRLYMALEDLYPGEVFNIQQFAVWVDRGGPMYRVNVRYMLDGDNPA